MRSISALFLRALCGLLLLGCIASCAAQSGDVVHVRPRSKIPSDGRLAVNVDMVLVPVTVTDQQNHPVVDLKRDSFRLFDDAREQEIRSFSTEDAPLSVGIIVDFSSSMSNKIDRVRAAVSEFFHSANPADDYFVITFADKPRLIADTTQSIEEIEATLGAAKAKGNTALADAVYMGLAKLKKGKYSRKALLVISDGGDNNSRHGLRHVKHVARESDAQIYAIDICDAPKILVTAKLEERFGRQWLNELTHSTGGRTLVVDHADAIPDAAARASLELRNQYLLGYHPAATDTKKWRKIKVEVHRSDDLLPLQVYYRTGYVPRGD